MLFIFIRHGHSVANQLHVIANRSDGYPLTDLGIRQITQLTNRLKDFRVNAIYTSPLLRAKQSAAILAKIFQLPINFTHALREYDCGELEGRSDDDAWKEYNKIMQAWMIGKIDTKPTGGESLRMMLDRTQSFIEQLRIDYPPESILLLVGHGGLYRHFLPNLCENINIDFSVDHPLGYGETIWVNLQNGTWVCKQWGKKILN